MATKKLIYADDARKAILHEAPHLAYCIDNLPVVDAVEVVRCKDCKHFHEETGWCKVHSHFVDRVGDFCYPEESGDWKDFDADYFCKDGERKDDGICKED